MAADAINPRLTLWIGSLGALALVNIGLWVWIAGAASRRTSYTDTQLLLSGLYVGVCGFRSLFPRVDLERVCLWDTWLSTIFLGRTLATIAELCFALQCVLFVQRLSDMTSMHVLRAGSHAFMPLVIVAELLCWYAVLSLNHIGHAIEESLWAVLMLILSVVFGAAAFAVHGPLRLLMITGCLVYGLGAALTIIVDVRMYLRRWQPRSSYLTLAAGVLDSQRRRHPIQTWEIWREEAPWMTLYFSVGVWTSLAMVLL